jgi:hypothetical protein
MKTSHLDCLVIGRQGRIRIVILEWDILRLDGFLFSLVGRDWRLNEVAVEK